MKRKSLVLECQKQIQCIKYKHIYYLQYQDGAITIHLTNDSKLLHCQALSEVEDKLPDHFVKVNRNIIINLRHMASYLKASQKILLTNGLEFPVSRRNIPALLDQIM